jgi:hypothetical protein
MKTIYRVTTRYDRKSYNENSWDFVFGRLDIIDNLDGAVRKFNDELAEVKDRRQWHVTLECKGAWFGIFWWDIGWRTIDEKWQNVPTIKEAKQT